MSFISTMSLAYDETVYQAQTKLKQLGYDPGKADGIFGEKTRSALAQFQQDERLEATGLLDNVTRDKLGLPISKTVSELEQSLEKNPNNYMEIVPQIEKAIISRITTGKKTQFLLSDIKPKAHNYEGVWFVEGTRIIDETVSFDMAGTRWMLTKHGPSTMQQYIQYAEKTVKEFTGSLTIHVSSEYGAILEYKGDNYPPFINNSSGGVGVFIGDKLNKKVATYSMLPMGDGSIHRFKEKVNLFGYTFNGEGDEKSRLTFVLTKNGYLYVRGKGKIILKDGQEVKLGY